MSLTIRQGPDYQFEESPILHWRGHQFTGLEPHHMPGPADSYSGKRMVMDVISVGGVPYPAGPSRPIDGGTLLPGPWVPSQSANPGLTGLIGFTQAQWDALVAALDSSLRVDSGGTQHIAAPAAGVEANFMSALKAAGVFTSDQISRIDQAIQGALGLSSGGTGHIAAPVAGVKTNILRALAGFDPANAPPPPPNAPSESGTGISAGDPLSRLIDTLAAGPTTPQLPTDVPYAVPTTNPPNVILPLLLLGAGGFGIYYWYKHRHAS